MTATPATQVELATERLVGDELISFVKKNSSLSKTDLAKAAGYYTIDKDGSVRCSITAMLGALSEASGFSFGNDASRVGVAGRKLSNRARVQGNGNLLVGKAYTKMLGLESGAEFEIKLSKQTGNIRLVPVGGAEDEE